MNKLYAIIAFVITFLLLASLPLNRSVTVPLVAVTDTGGIVVFAEVVSRPGSGNIYVSLDGIVGEDTQYSIKKAVFLAQKLSGKHIGFNDIYFYLGKDIIEGESAGVAFTAAVYALLTGSELNHDVVATGGVSLDGSVVKVGGVLEKLRAVAEYGAKVFIIPAENRYEYVFDERIVSTEVFPGIVVGRPVYSVKKVDIVKEGEKLGVNVIPVHSVEEALRYMVIR